MLSNLEYCNKIFLCYLRRYLLIRENNCALGLDTTLTIATVPVSTNAGGIPEGKCRDSCTSALVDTPSGKSHGGVRK